MEAQIKGTEGQKHSCLLKNSQRPWVSYGPRVM